MKVYRIEKETVSWKVGDVIAPSFNELIYSDKRLKAESLLENVRKSNYHIYIVGETLCLFSLLMINWKSEHFIGLVPMLLYQTHLV